MAPKVLGMRRSTAQPAPANRRASPQVRLLLGELHRLRHEGLAVLGQFTNFGSRATRHELLRIERATGHLPALVGVDYADFRALGSRRPSTQALMNAISLDRRNRVAQAGLRTREPNRVALSHAQAGGIVTIGAHFHNPTHAGKAGLRDPLDDVNRLLEPGDQLHRRWRAQLDHVAAGLGELRDHGVPVLWRPFHEMNGGWFWWGSKGPRAFGTLWRDMFDYFTHARGLDNLLWVFSPNMGEDAAGYFPGSDYVDVVGVDAYTDNLSRNGVAGTRQLARLGKPFGFTEFGPHGPSSPPRDFDCRNIDRALRRDFPSAVFLMSWNADWSPARNRHARSLYESRRLLTLGRFTRWTQVRAS
jgi:mannan endo-1,4-beta-mannosidase